VVGDVRDTPPVLLEDQEAEFEVEQILGENMICFLGFSVDTGDQEGGSVMAHNLSIT
jgi:hypothetical protein